MNRTRKSLAMCCAAILFAACSNDVLEPSSGPWIGDWIQVNFLADDDGGVWDADDLTGIGFVQSVTPTEWVLTDDFGSGCSVTFSYSVRSGNRFSRRVTGASPRCGGAIPIGLQDSGRLEFSPDDRFMIEWYDPQPGDEIVAFKFVRR